MEFSIELLWGLVDIRMPLVDTSYDCESALLPWDNSHGGTMSDKSLGMKLSELTEDLPGTCFQLPDNFREFCFVPQASALAIEPANGFSGGKSNYTSLQLKRAYSVMTDLSFTPFDNLYTEPTGNKPHTRFTPEAGVWLWDEISGKKEALDHSVFAQFTSGLEINTDADCYSDGGGLTLSKTPPAGISLNYGWSVQGVSSYNITESDEIASITSLNTTAESATVICTITGAYATDDYDWEETFSVPIVTNKPTGGSVSGPSSLTVGLMGFYSYSPMTPYNELDWTTSLEMSISSINYDRVRVEPVYAGPGGITAVVSNGCGTSYYNKNVNVEGGFGGFSYQAYPNPTTSSLSVEIEEEEVQEQQGVATTSTQAMTAVEEDPNLTLEPEKEKKEKAFKYDIYLFDTKGNIKYRKEKVAKKKIMIDVQKMKKGIYHLKVINSDNPEINISERVVIQ